MEKSPGPENENQYPIWGRIMPLTLRQTMAHLLREGEASARELAAELLLTPREVEEHLAHLARSQGKDFKVNPARCLGCGFVFASRQRLDAPGRCPQCKSNRIHGPWFTIKT